MTAAEALAKAVELAGDETRTFSESYELARVWVSIAAELRAQGAAPERPSVQDVELRYCEHGTHVLRLPGATERWWHPGSRTWCEDAEPTPVPATPAASPRLDWRQVCARSTALDGGHADGRHIALCPDAPVPAPAPLPGETRRPIPLAEPGGRTTKLGAHGNDETLSPVRECTYCGGTVEGRLAEVDVSSPIGTERREVKATVGRITWVHSATGERACDPSLDTPYAPGGTFAWPRAADGA